MTLVVPLGVDEVDHLTLGEWDALRASKTVAFERDDHPLAERLRAEGVDVIPLPVDLPVDTDGHALVVEPNSELVAELAAGGAVVTSGMATGPDALSAARGAYVARRAQASLGSLALVMARLRGPDGCPWDALQTHESLQQHLLEETHEVLEKIDSGDVGAGLEEELGALLLQVMFHSQLAADDGRFDIAGVADVIVAKLIRRHPHVFGDVTVADASEVISNWEKIKKGEKESASDDPFAGIPAGLPALVVASKTFKKAAGLDFKITEEEALQRARAAIDEGNVGDALMWLVALARENHVDAEGALRRAVLGFRESLLPRGPATG